MKISTANNHTRDKQAGDTIVEVIIAVAIVSSILVGAFFVTNHSAKAVRDSEEHAQALHILQGQVELLRHYALISGSVLTTYSSLNTSPFCLDSTGIYPASNPKCLINNLYRISITGNTASPTPNDTNTFTSEITWPSIIGGTDKIDLSYKIKVTP